MVLITMQWFIFQFYFFFKICSTSRQITTQSIRALSIFLVFLISFRLLRSSSLTTTMTHVFMLPHAHTSGGATP